MHYKVVIAFLVSSFGANIGTSTQQISVVAIPSLLFHARGLACNSGFLLAGHMGLTCFKNYLPLSFVCLILAGEG